jgi:hypothetical protein
VPPFVPIVSTNYILQSGSCVPCASDKYSSGNTCLPCDPSCLTCQDFSEYCLTCPPGSDYNPSLQTCTPCATNQFWNGASCQPCTSPCATCSGSATHCLSCVADHGLSSNACTICTGTTFYQGPQLPCASCTSPCATCETTGTNCLSCVDHHQFSANACNFCSFPHYWTSVLSTDPGTCHSCPSHCSACSSTVCTACEANYHLHPDDLCATCQIDNGFFVDGSDNNRCKECPTLNCKVCPGSGSTCTECQSSYDLMFTGLCQTCGSGEFYAPVSKTCSTVQYCANFATTCISCMTGYYWTGSACIQCSANCDACSDTTHCTQCSQAGGYLRYLIGQVDCDLCTTEGWYLNNNECRSCDPGCLGCSQSATHCTSCNTPMKLIPDQNTCVLNCPPDRFR